MRRLWPFVAASLCALAALTPAANADHPRGRGGERLHQPRVESHGDPARAFRRRARPSARPSAVAALPATWCGSSTTTDRPNPFTNAPQFKVLYAHPLGSPNNLASVANAIQADVGAIRSRLDGISGSSPRTVRFDLMQGCAGNHVDIETVALPRAAADYTSFELLRDDLEAATDPPLGARVNHLAYVEDVVVGGAAGQADVPVDESRGRGNAANRGGLFAMIYDPDLSGAGAAQRRATFLHELAHTLGAVQDGAPHSSRAGHCFDEHDVMCYADGGPGIPGGGLTFPCAAGADAFFDQFDCGGDDYWNPAPAAGSYLAQSWNVFDSELLCSSAACDVVGQNGPAVSLGVAGKALRGSTLTFTATPAAGAVYDWDLNGDGEFEATTDSAAEIAHAYAATGNVTARVRASAASGAFTVAELPLTIAEPVLPTPDFTFSPAAPATGQQVTLDASPTQDPDGVITRFAWDLDDNGALDVDNGLERILRTSFASPGPRFVWLQVDYPTGFRARAYRITVQTPAAAPAPVPVATVTVAKLRLKALLANGLPLSVRCPQACRVAAALTVDARTAKKLRLASRRLGSVTKSGPAGTVRAVLKLTRAAKRALRRRRTLTASLELSSPVRLRRKLRF